MMPSQQDDPMDIIDEQSIAPEFAVVNEVIRAHASEFAARGFTLTNVTMNPSQLIRSIVFHFTNDRAAPRLSVSSFLGRAGLKRGFNAMISTPDNRKLNVHDFLVRHGRSDMARLLTEDAPTDVRAFSESSVRMLIDLLDNELKPIVEGKTFEETPIDWQGYK
jgi:hypothetical protein